MNCSLCLYPFFFFFPFFCSPHIDPRSAVTLQRARQLILNPSFCRTDIWRPSRAASKSLSIRIKELAEALLLLIRCEWSRAAAQDPGVTGSIRED